MNMIDEIVRQFAAVDILVKCAESPLQKDRETYKGVPQTAEDMAEAVVFLSVSDHITGQALGVNGGSTA